MKSNQTAFLTPGPYTGALPGTDEGAPPSTEVEADFPEATGDIGTTTTESGEVPAPSPRTRKNKTRRKTVPPSLEVEADPTGVADAGCDGEQRPPASPPRTSKTISRSKSTPLSNEVEADTSDEADDIVDLSTVGRGNGQRPPAPPLGPARPVQEARPGLLQSESRPIFPARRTTSWT